jgi:hypothetical protein
MENYISLDYFSKIEELLDVAKKDILTGKASNLTALFQLLSALPLHINLNNSEVESYAIELMGTKNFTSLKDFIITNALKNQQLRTSETLDITNKSAFYFLDKNNMEELSKSNGIVCKGKEYTCDDFFENCTLTDEPIDVNWQPIENSVPPVNAMLIIDSFIFSNPFEKKLKSLIEFVKLYKGNLSIPFHLTILFTLDKGHHHLVKKAFQLLSEIGNIEVQLFADNNLPTSDRLIFTNYTSGNIGHPWDGRDTRFSQNFLGRDSNVERIRNNYKNYKRDLIKWNTVIKKIPGYFGVMQSKWETSTFTNRLFKAVIHS